jgi:hypothetical protein
MAHGYDHGEEHPERGHEESWPPQYRNGANDPKETRRCRECQCAQQFAQVGASLRLWQHTRPDQVRQRRPRHPSRYPPEGPDNDSPQVEHASPNRPETGRKAAQENHEAGLASRCPIGFDILVRTPVECRGPDESLNEGFDDVVPFTLSGNSRSRVDSRSLAGAPTRHAIAAVRRRQRLGGMLSYYYRAA